MGSLLFILAAVFLVGATAATHDSHKKCDRPNESPQCARDCPPERTCENRDIQYKCAVDNKECKLECRCKEGYYRNYLGNCVSTKVCEKCTGDHEFYDCGSECDNDCDTIDTQNRTNCPYVNIQCNKKCYCEDGFARDRSNKCVPVAQCKTSEHRKRYVSPKHHCKGPNEEYVRCKRICPPETCISLVAKFNCLPNLPCNPGCACKSGFLRPKPEEHCIPTKQCPQLANSPDVE